MAMEGEALPWMQWWESCNDDASWEDFKNALLRRSQGTVVANAFEVLIGLKQEGTVKEYRRKFETISGHVKTQDKELFLGMFSNGLRDDIRAEVRLHRPKDLAEMMDVALLAEEKLGPTGKTTNSSGLGKTTQPNRNFGGFMGWRTDVQSKNNAENMVLQNLLNKGIRVARWLSPRISTMMRFKNGERGVCASHVKKGIPRATSARINN